MNWLLIILVIFVAIKAVVSYKKGFAKMLLSLSASILTLVLVWLFAPAVKSFILEHTDAQETLAVRLDKALDGRLPELSSEVFSGDDSILPESLRASLAETLTTYRASGVHAVSLSISKLLITAASYGVLFLFLWLALKIVGYVLHLVTRLPVLKQVNGFMGLVLGLLEAYILIGILFVLITAFTHTELGMTLMEQIGSSRVLTFMYNYNLVVKLIFN